MYLKSKYFKENAKKISCFTGPIKGTRSVLPYSSTKKERLSLASSNSSFQPLFSDQSLVMEYQYLLGVVIASVLGWGLLLFFHAKGRRKGRVSMNIPSNRTLKSSENGLSWACNPEITDIIIVGAGVAGSALAYTLGKVTFHDNCFS